MASFVSINRLERSGRIEEALVDAEVEDSPRGRRWRIRQSGENRRPLYLPDHLFHELFAPLDSPARAAFLQRSSHN
jgi:hypothetical protein